MDPLANLNLSEADFGWATRKKVADLRSAGKVISVLEGGYAVQSLSFSSRGTRHGAYGVVNLAILLFF